MYKEPIGLYLFRYFVGALVLGFLAMLFWSSSLIEENVRDLQSDVNRLQDDLSMMQLEAQRTREEILQALMEERVQLRPRQEKTIVKNSPSASPEFPNLLSEDPFYTKTLPEILGPGFVPSGTLKTGTIGKPDNLHPFSGWADVSNWVGMCNVNVATREFGKYETFAPDMAVKVEERPSRTGVGTEFWVHLRDDAYWQPLKQEHFESDVVLSRHFLRKHRVTAHDFKFYLDAVMNLHVQEGNASFTRNYLADIEALDVIDDFTFVVRWRLEAVDGTKLMKYTAKQLTGSLQPLARFVYQHYADGKKIIEDDSDPSTYRESSVWAQSFSRHWARNTIVCCGPWIFDGKTDEMIRFRRNPDFYNPLAVLLERQEVWFRQTPESIWNDFKAGKLDLYALQPDQEVELTEFLESEAYQEQKEKGMTIGRLDYLANMYRWVGWNQRKPYFTDSKVRRALTMAIDRKRMIRQGLNGKGVDLSGPFHRLSPAYNDEIDGWPFDPFQASRLLAEAGWYDSDGDGFIDKEIDGKRVPFRFNLTYFVKNPVSKADCEYIATALKEVGVDCRLHGVDVADLSANFDDKSFDAIHLAWALGSPPEDPRQLWHSSYAKEKGSSNVVGFVNSEADAIMHELLYERDKEERKRLYHQFHQIIHEEAPYTFLYIPKSTLLYRDYVSNVFIPAERQDLVPGANVAQPSSSVYWIKRKNG